MRKKPSRSKGSSRAEGAEKANEAAENQTEESKKPSRLPAFGFAEDLLGKAKAETSPSDEGRAAAERQAREAASEAAAQVGEIAADDPERIFQFAAQLDSATAEEEKAKVRRLGTWVTFGLAGEIYAMPVEPIREIIRVRGITRVPHAPNPIRGVTNLRGRVIPVIDLRLRLDLAPTELERTTRVIVVASRNRLIGLLADAVHQVVHLDLDRIQPPPEDVMTSQSDYISGVYHLEDHLVLLLDVDRALVVRGAEEPPVPPTQTIDPAPTGAP